MRLPWSEDRPRTVAPPPNDSVDRLSELELFAGADETDVRRMASASEEARYGPGDRVIREGWIPSYLYVVLSGELDVWTTGDTGGDPKKVNTLGPGDHFGEVGLIEGMPSTATVTTTGPCNLLRIPARDFLDVAGSSPAVQGALGRSVGGAMARSHPTYQPATETSADPAAVVSQTKALLRTLRGPDREAFLRSMTEALDERPEG